MDVILTRINVSEASLFCTLVSHSATRGRFLAEASSSRLNWGILTQDEEETDRNMSTNLVVWGCLCPDWGESPLAPLKRKREREGLNILIILCLRVKGSGFLWVSLYPGSQCWAG